MYKDDIKRLVKSLECGWDSADVLEELLRLMEKDAYNKPEPIVRCELCGESHGFHHFTCKYY